MLNKLIGLCSATKPVVMTKWQQIIY